MPDDMWVKKAKARLLQAKSQRGQMSPAELFPSPEPRHGGPPKQDVKLWHMKRQGKHISSSAFERILMQAPNEETAARLPLRSCKLLPSGREFCWELSAEEKKRLWREVHIGIARRNRGE